MKYFYSLFIALLFIACSNNAHKNQTTYKFTDQDGQSIKIQTNLDTFDISADTKTTEDIEKITLIMFLDTTSEDAKNYILSLNDLKLNFPKAYIIGILTQKYPSTEVAEFVKTNNIHFTLLNPSDNKNLLDDFLKKINQANNADEKNSDKTDDKSPPANAQNSQNPKNEQNTQNDENAQQTQSAPSPKIPFFVLYDRHGKKYQTYSGMIPEEMFSYDIDTLSKKH